MDESLEKILIKNASQNFNPLTAIFELLPLCNMYCDMCYVRLYESEMNKRGRMLSVVEWIALAKQMAERGTLFILLTGGEPLLFSEFRKLYLELKNLGMIISINTNGTLINEEWADFFGRYKPRRINITLYGSSEETYAKLCHYPNGFLQVIHGIKLLKAQGVDVKLNVSLTKANQGDFEEIYSIGEKLNLPISTDTYMLPGWRERTYSLSDQSRLDPKTAAFMQLKVLKKEMPPNIFQQYVHNILTQIRDVGRRYPRGINCQAARCSCAVNWQGLLRPCVTLEEPSIDLRRHSFNEAWEKLCIQAQQLHINKKCSNCSLRQICHTCVGSAWIETGHYDGIPEYLCTYSAELFRLLQNEEKAGSYKNYENELTFKAKNRSPE